MTCSSTGTTGSADDDSKEVGRGAKAFDEDDGWTSALGPVFRRSPKLEKVLELALEVTDIFLTKEELEALDEDVGAMLAEWRGLR
jgi:hypothetical protein